MVIDGNINLRESARPAGPFTFPSICPLTTFLNRPCQHARCGMDEKKEDMLRPFKLQRREIWRAVRHSSQHTTCTRGEGRGSWPHTIVQYYSSIYSPDYRRKGVLCKRARGTVFSWWQKSLESLGRIVYQRYIYRIQSLSQPFRYS